MKIPQLQARLGALEAAKTSWIAAHTTFSNAINERNALLYHPETGLKASTKCEGICKELIWKSKPTVQASQWFKICR
ncbi:MAG: hypothetical protein IPO48_10040 [Saprospiraceae bacterium]|nr:hypothetical protein [Saprospiraceae bacterium]